MNAACNTHTLFSIQLYLKGDQSGAVWSLPCLQNDYILATRSEDYTLRVELEFHHHVYWKAICGHRKGYPNSFQDTAI